MNSLAVTDKKRNIALDITKGIAILLVIVGHCGKIPYMPFRHLIFTFHMPLFFLVSGYFYKQRSLKKTLLKDIVHLGVPYVVTCIAILLFYLLSWVKTGNSKPFYYYASASLWGNGTEHTCRFLGDSPIIGAIWFLPALLVCKNTYNLLPSKSRLLFSSVIFVLATVIGRYLIFIPFSVLSGLSAIVFYAIGDFFKGIKRIPLAYWIIGIICWVMSFKYSRINLVQPRLDLYFVDVIGATTMSLLVYCISKSISKIPIISSSLSWVGKSSLLILCFHLIDLDCKLSTRINSTGSIVITVLLRIVLPLLGAFCFRYLWAIGARIKNSHSLV